jgi:hypothetical protein
MTYDNKKRFISWVIVLSVLGYGIGWYAPDIAYAVTNRFSDNVRIYDDKQLEFGGNSTTIGDMDVGWDAAGDGRLEWQDNGNHLMMYLTDDGTTGDLTTTGELNVKGGVIENTDDEDLTLKTSGNANQLVLDSGTAGNVGIGLNDPTEILEIEEGTNTTLVISETAVGASGLNTIAMIHFKGLSHTSVQRTFANIQVNSVVATNAAEASRLDFQTMSAGTLATRMVIKRDDIGFGTTAPLKRVDVEGDINMTGGDLDADSGSTINLFATPTTMNLGAAATVNISVAGSTTTVKGTLDVGADGGTRGVVTAWDGSGGSAPGVIKLGSPNGTAWYLFVEDDGTLKAHSSLPTANGDGSEIGAQS